MRDILDRPDVPDADAAEQAREISTREPPVPPSAWAFPLEVAEYDAAQQRIAVEDEDEDEYR